jgi:hypothetical protein
MLNPESVAGVCGRKICAFMNLLLIFILRYESMDIKATTIIMGPKPK